MKTTNDISKHYKYKRCKREEFIKKYLDYGCVIDSFIVDKGHVDGIERHDILDTGIIVIYNVASGKLITKLIARENQIKRYYEFTNKEPPSKIANVLRLAQIHEMLGYNEL